MKMNFDKPIIDKKECVEKELYGGIGSLDVSAFKGVSVGVEQQNNIKISNIESEKKKMSQKIEDFKDFIKNNIDSQTGFDQKIEFINKEINSLKNEIEDAKKRIIIDSGNFEDGFLDKIFDSEGNVIKGSDDSSTIRGVRDIFRLAEEKMVILNEIKSGVEFASKEQTQDEFGMREAA